MSAYGGVIAANTAVTADMARQIKPIFTEVVAAPAFEEEAVEILSAKKNLRLLVVEPPARGGYEIKQVTGGAVIQERDAYQAGDADPATWRLVAGEAADAETLADLSFAWRTIRSVRSNAILLARDGATVGVGMGQVNRVDSCRLAVERANTLGLRSTGDAAAAGRNGRQKQEDRGSGAEKSAVGGADASEVLSAAPPERARGAVAASDAFFPFADGLQVLIDAGVRAVVQPGGSISDPEVIAAAQAAGGAQQQVRECPAQWCDVLSSFFEVQGRLRLDDVALQETAAVQRGQGRHPPVTVLWRQRQPLTGLKED